MKAAMMLAAALQLSSAAHTPLEAVDFVPYLGYTGPLVRPSELFSFL